MPAALQGCHQGGGLAATESANRPDCLAFKAMMFQASKERPKIFRPALLALGVETKDEEEPGA